MGSSQSSSGVSAGGVSENDALRRMYRIGSDYTLSFDQKITKLLALGRAYFGVETGFLSEIEDGTLRIVAADSEDPLVQTGESCPLSTAYCRKTVDEDSAITVQHAAIEGWEQDAAYEAFGLESYIGAKVVVNDEVYGTFCFADSEPREKPFSEAEETFIELLAQWTSYELFQKQATQEIKRQRDRLEEFTGVVSHDLRNPLGVVQGYLNLAEETGDPEHFERCRNALDRMEMLIDDLLALAREGEDITDTETVDLEEVTETSWSFISNEGATLKLETDRAIRANWSRIQQLFENLFRNATEHGGDSVTIRIGELADRDGIYIEDDGVGIPETDRDEIFEDGYSTSEQGTGYGLTIVKQIVDAHDWEIRVTESESGGARFEITDLQFVE